MRMWKQKLPGEVNHCKNTFGTFFYNPYFCTPKSIMGERLGYGVKVAQQILILFV